jgi:hypothetical protein
VPWFPPSATGLKEKNFTARIKVRGDAFGRTFTFRDGKVTSEKLACGDADMSMVFRDTASAVRLMTAPHNYMKQINAMKNFVVDVEGEDHYAIWFMQTLKRLQGVRAVPVYGTPVDQGMLRYVSNTNGGPVFVYVKKGRIVRITPIEFDDQDAAPWTIQARGKCFTPPRRGDG